MLLKLSYHDLLCTVVCICVSTDFYTDYKNIAFKTMEHKFRVLKVEWNQFEGIVGGSME